MTTRTRLPTALSALLLGVLAAGCSAAPESQPGTDAPVAEEAAAGKTFIGRQAAKAIAKASQKLQAENLRIGNDSSITINGRSYGSRRSTDGLPQAEITPEGDLLIDGEAVSTTAEQRALLLVHRGHLEGLALAGLAIGAQGADIAGTALTGIGEALFGGEDGRRDYEARIEAEAAGIEQEAQKLCALMPALYDSQQSLAASLPAFAPYATMTPGDVDDCGHQIDDEPAADTGDAISA